MFVLKTDGELSSLNRGADGADLFDAGGSLENLFCIRKILSREEGGVLTQTTSQYDTYGYTKLQQ